MAPVDVAMLNSLGAGPLEKVKTALARSIASQLTKKDIIGDAQQKVTDVKTAFSSWDNCMKATFCKWPVIAVIVVGTLIILAIVWCIIRCAWCGVSCCCSCFRCLKCGECCGCCDPPRRAQRKYLDEPFIPPHQGYRNEAPMQAPFAPRQPPAPPQYAEFDVSKKGPEDSLPQMPSWESAGSKKVEEETDAVELNQLKSPASDQRQPLMNGPPHSGPNSPMPMDRPTPSPSPYGPQRGPPLGAMAVARSQQPMSPNPYAPQNQGLHPGMHQNSYQDQKRESVGFGLDDEPYDTVPGSTPFSPGQSPVPMHHSQGPPPTEIGFVEMPAAPVEPSVLDGHGQSQRMPPMGASGGAPPGYGMRRQGTGDGARSSPAPYGMDPRMRNSPAPGQVGPGRRTPGTPGPRDAAFAQSPRGSPAPPPNFGGYGRPGFNSPQAQRSQPDRKYSSSPGQPPRDQTYSPGLNRGFERDQVDRPYSPGPPRTNLQENVQISFSPAPLRAGPHERFEGSFSPAPTRAFTQDETQRAYSPAPPGPPSRSFSATSSQMHQGPDRAHTGTPDRPLNMPDRSFAATPGHGTELHMSRPFAQDDSAPGSPLTNNAGFDFVSGNSRPSESNDNDSAQAYPGHKPYRAN